MSLTPAAILLIVSLIFTILNAIGKAQLWPAVLCLILAVFMGVR